MLYTYIVEIKSFFSQNGMKTQGNYHNNLFFAPLQKNELLAE